MQMLGVGLPELLLIMFLAVVVIGPDRLPGFAADLARWIRRARVYANHLSRDFNEVISDFEKEAGASREDWKEITNLVTRNTSDIAKELTAVSRQLEEPLDVDERRDPPPSNVVPFEQGLEGESTPIAERGPEEDDMDAEPEAGTAEEKPWFVPEAPARRRSRE
jgi:sec-independent protein translocase protein TatB